jgi:toxin ParE1/3/4
MLPVTWSASALDNLTDIVTYIAERNPLAADRLKQLIEAAIVPAAEHPYIYRSGRVPGTREIVVHPNYVLVYRVKVEAVEVLAVLHARQEYP